MTKTYNYIRIEANTKQEEFAAICHKFADLLKVDNEFHRIEFLAECFANTSFGRDVIWTDPGCTWIALIDDGSIIQMEEDEQLDDDYNLVTIPAPVRDSYCILMHGLRKEDLPCYLEQIAYEFKIIRPCDLYEFVGVLLKHIPMIAYKYSDSVSKIVKFDLAIYPSGEYLPIDLEKETYYNSISPIQGEYILSFP